MKRPEITLENYEAVYAYYEQPKIKPRINRAVFASVDWLYKPDVLLPTETREAIESQIALGKGALLALNHPSQHDPFLGAGAMHNTGIPGLQAFSAFAKDSLFRNPVTRAVFENTGCVPVFRRKSYPNVAPEVFTAATERLLRMAAARLRNGVSVAMMPEGTRSKPENLQALTLDSIKSGIAKTALYAGDEHSFIVPVGLDYDMPNLRGVIVPPRNRVVAFGPIITEYTDTVDGVREQVYLGMQTALDMAVDHTHKR